MMVITAESGATKTDWLVDGRRYRTKGINFSVLSDREIVSIVGRIAAEIERSDGARGGSGSGFGAGFGSDIEAASGVGEASAFSGDRIYFYGAGLVSEENILRMTGILHDFFPDAQVECASDLLAAARALWGDNEGIAAILGTGSNSCSYDGRTIVRNVRPGGFILGDEGGGAALGRRFISDFIKDLLPEILAESFRQRYQLKYEDIVNAVYKGQNPAGFLASFAPFVIEAAESHSYARELVSENLKSFIVRSLLSYKRPDEVLDVGVVGSIGVACRPVLEALGQEYGINFCKFISSPVDELGRYHSLRP